MWAAKNSTEYETDKGLKKGFAKHGTNGQQKKTAGFNGLTTSRIHLAEGRAHPKGYVRPR